MEPHIASPNGASTSPPESLADAVARAVVRKIEERRKIHAVAEAVVLHLREFGLETAVSTAGTAPAVSAPVLSPQEPAHRCFDHPLIFGSPPEAPVCSPSTYTRGLLRALNHLGYAVRVSPEYACLPDAWHYRRLAASPEELREGCVVELGRAPQVGARRVVLELVDMFRAHRRCQEYQSVDLTLTVSDYSLEEIRRVGVDPLRSAAFPLGVDLELFRPGLRAWDWRSQLAWTSGPVPENPFVVLAHGFWQERKGLRFALEAYRAAFGREPGGRRSRRGRAAGGRRNAPEPVLLVKSVPKLWGQSVRDLLAASVSGDDPVVALTEADLPEGEMPALYAAADVVLHLHRIEAFGLIPLEAMACGRPVVLTDYGGVREYATAGTTVLVPPLAVVPLPTGRDETTGGEAIEPEVAEVARGGGYSWAVPDVAAAAAALRELRDHPARRSELGRAARERAEAFSWERAAERLVEACEDHGVRIRRTASARREPGLVSVCIPVYNALPDLKRLLRSLFELTAYPHFEAVVVDDGSTEDLWEWLQAFRGEYPERRLRAQRHLSRQGIPKARTRAWWMARGEYLCSLDCDVEVVDPDWLDRLVAVHESGITGGKLLMPDGRLQHAGVMLDLEGMPALHRSYRESDVGQCDRRERLIAVTGALQFFRGSLLEEVGGLYEGYGDYGYEDIDWCLEVRRLGYPITYDPSVRLVHHEGSYRRAGGDYDIDEAYRRFRQRWPSELVRGLAEYLQ